MNDFLCIDESIWLCTDPNWFQWKSHFRKQRILWNHVRSNSRFFSCFLNFWVSVTWCMKLKMTWVHKSKCSIVWQLKRPCALIPSQIKTRSQKGSLRQRCMIFLLRKFMSWINWNYSKDLQTNMTSDRPNQGALDKSKCGF